MSTWFRIKLTIAGLCVMIVGLTGYAEVFHRLVHR